MRVVVADDAVILREGLARLLTEAGFHVVGLAGDAEELFALVEQHRPDVAVVDIRMPPTHTDEGLRAPGQRDGSRRTGEVSTPGLEGVPPPEGWLSRHGGAPSGVRMSPEGQVNSGT
jgi:CheY-like chemotaxis protein